MDKEEFVPAHIVLVLLRRESSTRWHSLVPVSGIVVCRKEDSSVLLMSIAAELEVEGMVVF
jgi:hypothetical protein